MIKFSRALKQWLKLSPSDKTVYPNANWAQPFTLNVCGDVAGDKPQYIFGSGGNPPDVGAINGVLRTNTSLPYANKLQIYADGKSTAILQSTDAYSNGIHAFALVKVGLVMELWHCPPLSEAPTDDSQVSVQATYTLAAPRAFAAPDGIYIGSSSSEVANRMLDQAVSRIGRIDGTYTKMDLAMYAYGKPLTNPAWYVGDTLDDIGEFAIVGTPTEVPGPEYGYSEWGTFLKPFNVNSLWNATVINPKFGTFSPPRDWNSLSPYQEFNPIVAAGDYSTQMCPVYPSDPPMTVYAGNSKGIKNSDENRYYQSITFKHWNDGVVAATGTDGHCDVVDMETGTIQNFWVQKKDAAGRWTALLVGFCDIAGYGWGNGGQYIMGARSAGVPSGAGIIRKHEVNDGQPMYNHALTMSLSKSGLSGKNGGFIPPATMADNTYYENTGEIPLGARMGLLPEFDTSDANADELKLATSLKPGGKMAFVADRNTDTPFVFYVENGGPVPNIRSSFLNRMRPFIRQVISYDGILNGDGKPLVPENPNRISLRGPYTKINGTTGALPMFNSATQTVDYPATTVTCSTEQNGACMAGPERFKLEYGKRYRLETYGSGEAKIRLTLNQTVNGLAQQRVSSGNLLPGQSFEFTWTLGDWPAVSFSKPIGAAASIGATLKEVL